MSDCGGTNPAVVLNKMDRTPFGNFGNRKLGNRFESRLVFQRRSQDFRSLREEMILLLQLSQLFYCCRPAHCDSRHVRENAHARKFFRLELPGMMPDQNKRPQWLQFRNERNDDRRAIAAILGQQTQHGWGAGSYVVDDLRA